jgi:hypothetical protein
MRDRNKILIVVLALMLAGSNMAFSGHISSHSVSDNGLCTLCIHHGGTDSAIVPHSPVFFASLTPFEPGAGYPPALVQSADLFDHQSRAPPSSS